jgi:hypothetical protein
MFQTIAIQQLYMGCFGLGFFFCTASLFLSGGRVKGASRAGTGRGGQVRLSTRGGGTRSGSGSHAGAKSVRRGNAKTGTATKSGGARGAAKVSGRAQAKVAGGRSATKVPGVKGGASARGNSKTGDAHLAETHGMHLPHVSSHGEPLGETYVNCHDTALESEIDYKDQVFFFLMGILNPMSIAMSIFLFGASGLVILNYFPNMTKDSLIPAGFAALVLTMLFQNLLGMFAAKVENSALHILDDAIGSIGEITVPIPQGKTGEVMFVLGEGRKNYSAKCLNADKDIKRGTKVVIIDLEDSLALVEPCDDIYIDTDD